MDALAKLHTMGVPLQFLLERYGLEPHDVQRVMGLAAEEKHDAMVETLLKETA